MRLLAWPPPPLSIASQPAPVHCRVSLLTGPGAWDCMLCHHTSVTGSHALA